MARQRLVRTAAGRADAGGNVTLRFDDVPQSLVWTGTLSVPNADLGSTWTVYNGQTAVAGSLLGSWLGRAVFGPVQAWSMERLVLVGSGLTANANVQAVLIGTSEDSDTAEAVFPLPFVSSLSLAQLVAGTLCVGPAGNQICIEPEAPPFNITTILFDDGNTTEGHIQALPGTAPASSLEIRSPFSLPFLPAQIQLNSGALASIAILADRLQWTAQNSGLTGNIPTLIDVDGGVPNLLTTQTFMQVGNPAAGVATTAGGIGTINFPTAFPTGVIVVLVIPTTPTPGMVAVNSQTAAGFTIECRTTAGALRASATQYVEWIAIGY